MSLNPKPQAASHMFWFFLLPCLGFMGWASYKLVKGLGQKPEKISLLAKVERIKMARSPGDRWQSAYAVSQELQQMIRGGGLEAMKEGDKIALYSELNSLMSTHASDARLNKYLLLTLGQMGDPMALPSIEKHLEDSDAEVRFFAAWSFIDILSKNSASLNTERKIKIASLLESRDPALQKIATTFLVQQKDEALIARIRLLLKDSDHEVRWNAAVALASIKDTSAAPILKEMFDLSTLHALGIKSQKDLEQLVATAAEAALKLGDADVNLQAQKLAEQSNPKTPEGRAILMGLRAAKVQTR